MQEISVQKHINFARDAAKLLTEGKDAHAKLQTLLTDNMIELVNDNNAFIF